MSASGSTIADDLPPSSNVTGRSSSPQAANAGLRICLRVNSEEDSRALVGGPDAATLSSVGRAVVAHLLQRLRLLGHQPLHF